MLPTTRRSAKRLELEWSENLDSFSALNILDNTKNHNPATLLWELVDVPILLIIIGCTSAFVSFIVSYLVTYSNAYRMSLVGGYYDVGSWSMFCLWCVVFAVAASLITQSLCPQAVGGGLPEMKTILGGVVKPVLLSKRMIVAKTCGLILALSAGLSVGKEGPFVQISAAIADQVMRLSAFQHIRRQDGRRLEIIACACASGVSATFGSAFGGVLFSMEFTASAYRVKNLPKAFLTAVVTMLVILVMGARDRLSLFANGTGVWRQYAPNLYEILGFVAIGVLCGLLGAAFVTIVESISKLRNSLLDQNRHSKWVVGTRRYLLVGGVSLVVAALMYLEASFSPAQDAVSFVDSVTQGDFHHTMLLLLLYLLYKALVTALSVTLPLPVGLFTPVFLIGGVLGRIIGEMLSRHPSLTSYQPWEYALIGAAAFSTGVVRAISTVVIVYEVSGQPHLLLPISVAVLCAYFTGNRLTRNIYEVLMDASNTPYLKDLPKELYNVPVSQVMVRMDEDHVLTLSSTYREAVQLLEVVAEATKKSDVALSAASHKVVRQASFRAQEDSFDIKRVHTPASRAGSDDRSPFVRWQDQPDQTAAITYHHIPAVIPVVQSKRSMVIVGAVLRSDLKKSVHRLLGIGADSYSAERWADAEAAHLVESIRSPAARLSTAAIPELTPLNSSAAPFAPVAPNRLDEVLQFVVFTNHGRLQRPVHMSSARTNVRTRRLGSAVDEDLSSPLPLPLDTSPYQLVDSMQLSKVDMLFRLLSLNQAYVTNSGRLVGLVTRAAFREFIGSRVKKPTDRCCHLWRAATDFFKRHDGYSEVGSVSSVQQEYPEEQTHRNAAMARGMSVV